MREMKFDYDMSKPGRVYILPPVLKEISGITGLDDGSIACVEDNWEIIFIYDLNQNRISRQYEVGGKGDFEGVASVNNTIYILRSDGVLSEIVDYESVNYKKTVFTTGVPWGDNEGLCYDHLNKRLLIGPKKTPGKKSASRKLRFIYGFSLDTKELIGEPVFTFYLPDIENFALDNKVSIPLKRKKGKKKEMEMVKVKPDIRFSISALAIHPFTGRLFVISSRDKLLFVFNMNGNIEHIEKLNPELFGQSEGICFMKNGDMLVCNEGKKKKKPPTIVRLTYSGQHN